ncbi:hypothetical protein FE257_007603 [Aspergillus nanangensis]|uniref:Zinc finger Mcm10/DnaG-type domain-containing protein n=1 Tax=Aspergillus nanangensis TaxID=2582783 RepID=A0AAD4CM92_ASPNN|nr:hypothetical protein FE257_007603 [Aspergillus nanangensis]
MQRRRELGSPLKYPGTSPNPRSKASQLLSDEVDDLEEEDDEDEETLELKLAAIKARLKLKQLQKNRGKSHGPDTDSHDGENALSRPASAVSFSSRNQDYTSKMHNKSQTDEVQVPLSPTRRAAPPTDPVSPRRYLLGIDKGLKGSEVSLKRPPSSRLESRPTSRLGSRDGIASRSSNAVGSQSSSFEEPRRVKSFSERMAESRNAEKLRRERAERLQTNRSSAFQFDKSEMESFKTAAVEARTNSPLKSPSKGRQAESFSREDILRSSNNLKPALKRSQTAPSSRRSGDDGDHHEPRSYLHRRNNKSESAAVAALPNSSQSAVNEDKEDGGGLEKAPDPSKFEAFSSLHLSNRILPHSFLTRTLADKRVLRIPDLLRTVKGPAFELPEDIDGDFVVFGIVASKSEPKQIKESRGVSAKDADPYDDGLNNTDRYMAITLTDLKWTIDLFLFDTAFPRYYRVSEGILIAILNPTIMPPPKNKTDTNKFSLALSSSDDKILEVGYAQDIGFCKAVRKDGKTCQSWVDGRKTEFCDFHVDLQVRRTQSQRMGVNGGTGMFGPGGRSGSRTGFFGDGGKKGGYKSGLKPNGGAQWDQGSQSTYYIAQAPKARGGGPPFHHMAPGQSAAALIDGDNDDPFIAAGMMGRGMENKQERLRRRLAEQQREREITKKLTASRGGGLGAEYLRARNAENVPTPKAKAGATNNNNNNNHPNPSSAKSLLMGFRKADSVQLTPMKRLHDGDKPHGSGVKKTRFITAKGIKEAGRDSLGGNTNYDDDDDDLDII